MGAYTRARVRDMQDTPAPYPGARVQRSSLYQANMRSYIPCVCICYAALHLSCAYMRQSCVLVQHTFSDAFAAAPIRCACSALVGTWDGRMVLVCLVCALCISACAAWAAHVCVWHTHAQLYRRIASSFMWCVVGISTGCVITLFSLYTTARNTVQLCETVHHAPMRVQVVSDAYKRFGSYVSRVRIIGYQSPHGATRAAHADSRCKTLQAKESTATYCTEGEFIPTPALFAHVSFSQEYVQGEELTLDATLAPVACTPAQLSSIARGTTLKLTPGKVHVRRWPRSVVGALSALRYACIEALLQLPSPIRAAAPHTAALGKTDAGALSREAVSAKSDMSVLSLRALAAAGVLGYRGPLYANHFNELFVTCGIAHVISVSGAHLAMLSVIITSLLKRIAVPHAAQQLLCLCVCLVFCVLSGASISVVRACMLVCVQCVCSVLHRKKHTLSSLSCVGIVMIVSDNSCVVQPAFILSMLCVHGIALFERPFAACLQGFCSSAQRGVVSALEYYIDDGRLPAHIRSILERCWRVLRSNHARRSKHHTHAASLSNTVGTTIATTLAAQLSCLAYTILAFRSVSVIGIVVNVLLVPFIMHYFMVAAVCIAAVTVASGMIGGALIRSVCAVFIDVPALLTCSALGAFAQVPGASIACTYLWSLVACACSVVLCGIVIKRYATL